eukprot:TRINITY_DN13629_c0_g1_i1.p1 TRINITY_DN13629_c0_g1~~TRINITY_DN13629_c0_g1_i1.p1  ORF type:complete len:215 (+),score=38.47 TRINITY_DN13629_c0_g1_i1:37-681(+)
MQEEVKYEKESQNSLELLLSYYNDEKWENVNTNEKDVLLKTKTLENNPVIIKRSEGKLDCSAQKIFEYVWSQKFEDKQKYENTLGDEKIIVPINDNRHIRYQKYNLPWPIATRDVILLRNKFLHKIGDDECYVQLDTSIEDSTIPDPDTLKKNVRAKLLIGGLIFRPLSENSCYVTYFLQMDLSGSIPTFFVNMSQERIAKRINSLREFVKLIK